MAENHYDVDLYYTDKNHSEKCTGKEATIGD